jgi:hypothetical protein
LIGRRCLAIAVAFSDWLGIGGRAASTERRRAGFFAATNDRFSKKRTHSVPAAIGFTLAEARLAKTLQRSEMSDFALWSGSNH